MERNDCFVLNIYLYKGEKMLIKGNKGFTLIEVLLVTFIIALIVAVTYPINKKVLNRAMLKTTATDIENALLLAQQLSIDESKNYCVEWVGDTFRVREKVLGGSIIYRQKIDKNIKIVNGSDGSITYNREGITSYGKFIIANRYRDEISIEVLIGTGQIKVKSTFN